MRKRFDTLTSAKTVELIQDICNADELKSIFLLCG